MKDIIKLEQRINTNIDLLEIAKDYCEFNQDKSCASSLLSLIEVVLTNQKKLISEFDKVV